MCHKQNYVRITQVKIFVNFGEIARLVLTSTNINYYMSIKPIVAYSSCVILVHGQHRVNLH